ncbi:ABC transporter [Streptomyces sp. NPDC046197]|uniref:ABC transporter n=1 Tax=Streptomyces sp. NPDC046197 TaxID=3154337 RepID=UPI0033CAEF88
MTVRPARAAPRTASVSGVGTVIGALVRPEWRSLPWPALAGAGALGLLTAGVVRLPGQEPDVVAALVLLRLAALGGGLSLAFVSDDPARHTTAAVPVRRAVRAALRVALLAPLVVAWWTAMLFLVPAEARPPAGAVTLEAAAVATGALALAAAAVRFGDEPRPGGGIAVTLLVLALVAVLVPRRWSLLVLPDDPNWAAAHGWWAAILMLAGAVWAMCVPEPLRRRSVRSGRPPVTSRCGTSGPSRTW